ncbi:hypothetical protein J3Q64DRAFT_1713141 [Phycomyces blakesleeanus]|uniref:F-box domain-containing protein n=1 Tax=Phycomyces blakesleeanus TaxID=4837 RepID=A0ABR3BGD4_PHYBL
MVKVTEMLSERSCIFPCLKKIDFEEASGLSVPDSVFLNMFSKFPGTIDHFHYTFPESSFSSSEERISFGMLPVLVNLRVKLLSGYVELDLLLKNCPAMKKLYLEAGKVTFSTIFPQNVSRHGLQEIELDSMEVHSDIYRHISNCCRELSSMRVRNIRMEDTDSSEFKSIYLDMPYTRLKMLNLVRFRLSHQTYDKQCLHYTHLNRIQLLTIEQTGPITRPIDSLPDENNQRNMAATSWFHQYRVNAHPSIERAVWMLGEEETRVAEFYFSSASSGVSQRVEDPNTARDCFGLVDKSSWKDDLLRGYIKLRCKSVAVCNIDGTIFYGGV